MQKKTGKHIMTLGGSLLGLSFLFGVLGIWLPDPIRDHLGETAFVFLSFGFVALVLGFITHALQTSSK